jgi:hypothetical protein
MATSPEASTLDVAGRIELRIVAAGARQDMGQAEAAVVTLQVPELESRTREPWLARLRSAYADALYAVGRDDEGRVWLERAADVDESGETHAAQRLLELDGLTVLDMVGEDDDAADDQSEHEDEHEDRDRDQDEDEDEDEEPSADDSDIDPVAVVPVTAVEGEDAVGE